MPVKAGRLFRAPPSVPPRSLERSRRGGSPCQPAADQGTTWIAPVIDAWFEQTYPKVPAAVKVTVASVVVAWIGLGVVPPEGASGWNDDTPVHDTS